MLMKKYKSFIIIILFTMGLQAIIYFLTKYFISDYNIISSVINVPLVKYFIYFYDSWYPFIIINAFIIYKYDNKNNTDKFNYLIVTMLISALLSHLTFIIYPSMVIRPTIEVKGITDWILYITYKSDTPAVNCLPSMHCVYCFVTSFYILECKNMNIKKRFLIVGYLVLIVLSTLFIKQHIIEDIILSLIYTTIAIVIVYFNKERINKLFNKIYLYLK